MKFEITDSKAISENVIQIIYRGREPYYSELHIHMDEKYNWKPEMYIFSISHSNALIFNCLWVEKIRSEV